MLKLKNINKDYVTSNETVKALKDVTLEFRESEFVSVLGPSGCGKTTLLNIIGGLDAYTEGDLIINGVSTKKYKDKDWDNYRNHSVGFVFQNYNLIMHQSVLANVELALTLTGVSKENRRKRAIEVLEEVGLGNQLYKKPGQMSGGQMQRVAIARALVNNPDILLADEPTGALDSKTSLQIMEILKKISENRLIIMVTHNPEIAKKYSSRIINLFDGEVISDSLPYDGKSKKNKKAENKANNKKSMSFLTAMSLSLTNLLTKKGRTLLTSFAGSIGIIGIALILSLSNGVKEYISKVEEETLASYPLIIEQKSIDANDFLNLMTPTREKEVHDDGLIHSNDMMFEMMSTMTAKMKTNNLEVFKKYIEEDSNIKDYTSAVSYGYDLNLQLYKENEKGYIQVNPNKVFEDMGFSLNEMQKQMVPTDIFIEMFNNDELNKKTYDLVKGSWPKNYNEVVVLVDEFNEISDYTLYALGLKDSNELKEVYKKIMNGEEIKVEPSTYSYDDLLNLKFKVLLNSDYYKYSSNRWSNEKENTEYVNGLLKSAEEIKVVGIIKINEESISNVSTGGVLYTKELTEHVINKINNTKIAMEQKNNPKVNVLTGLPFSDNKKFDINSLSNEQKMYLQSLSPTDAAKLIESFTKEAGLSYDDVLKEIGIIDLNKPSKINLYPKDFDSKEKITDMIGEYNDVNKEENNINYTDLVGVMLKGVTTIIDVIGYVLMAFVSISLIVSSIMIGIITYISVLERTKEIGILRSIGASKKDVSRVFNAETFIVGLISGLMGILVTILLNIPINIIIKQMFNISNISVLPVSGAIILVSLSVLLTILAGLIPAKMASKKDPVEALRTE
ncbi:MAG: ABC transporter ATP-binding protein/permease [Bacilli bacterium]